MKHFALSFSSALWLWGFVLAPALAAPAESFVNFDFENVNTNTSRLAIYPLGSDMVVTAGSGPTGDLLPKWTLSLSGFQLSSIGYNSAGSEAGGHAGIFERPVLEAQYYSISQIPPADKGK